MKRSTIKPRKEKKQHASKRYLPALAIVFWLIVWQVAAVCIAQEILLASPVSVFRRLLALLPQWDFWRSVFFTFGRILLGYLVSIVTAVVLASFAARFSLLQHLLQPLVSVMQTTPVASITILLLIWISPKNLSFIMALIMTFPVMYSNVRTGIIETDGQLLEMAHVFQVPFPRQLRRIYIPQVLPYFRTAAKLTLGLCWKSGVAAEVIGQPNGSIGDRLYQAKIYLETADLFAWTITIVLVSILMDRVLMWMLTLLSRRLEGD